MTSRLAGRRLYIADLARRQAAWELGKEPMNPIGYRVLAKRLRAALAGQSPRQLRCGFPELPQHLMPLLTEALEARHFDEHGRFCDPVAHEARVLAQALLLRLRGPGTLAR